jgi:hypothetical protein
MAIFFLYYSHRAIKCKTKAKASRLRKLSVYDDDELGRGVGVELLYTCDIGVQFTLCTHYTVKVDFFKFEYVL